MNIILILFNRISLKIIKSTLEISILHWKNYKIYSRNKHSALEEEEKFGTVFTLYLDALRKYDQKHDKAPKLYIVVPTMD